MMDNKKILLLFLSIIIASVMISGCTTPVQESSEPTNAADVASPPLEAEIQVTPDGTKYIVHPSKIRGGGPPQGSIGKRGLLATGIPALAEENIKFVSVAEADEWIEDNELVLALVYKDVKRVYPLQILVWHEIANDVAAGDHLVITYCPLCGSGIAYKADIEVDGQKKATRFGTSGKLYQSNLVMYDEATESYWQQIDGKAIVGELTGQELEEVSIDTVVWRDWKQAHPDSEVLSQDTGIDRNYGKDPYGSYYEDSYLIFPVEHEDTRIHPKTMIIGIEINGQHKAYIKEQLSEEPLTDTFADTTLKIEKLADGRVTVTDLDTNQEIVKEEEMWFAWYAFHPNTELHERK